MQRPQDNNNPMYGGQQYQGYQPYGGQSGYYPNPQQQQQPSAYPQEQAYAPAPQQNYAPAPQQNYAPDPYSQNYNRPQAVGGAPNTYRPQGQSYGGYQQDNQSYGSRGGYRGGYDQSRPQQRGSYRGRGGYTQRREMVVVKDTVYVTGLPQDVTVQQLEEVYGPIGAIKKDSRTNGPRIVVHTDRETGAVRGTATVAYESEESAEAAIKELDGKELLSSGHNMKVELAKKREGGAQGPARNNNRAPDWPCPGCSNNNFGWRTSCNRCQEPRPADGQQQGGGEYRGRGGYRGGAGYRGGQGRQSYRPY